MNPIIFEEYDHRKAITQFPLISTMSTDQEIEDTAWQYASDVMRTDPTILQEAFIGEHLSSLAAMNSYHEKVLQAIVEKDYFRAGKLVEDAMGTFVDHALDYIEQHIEQLRYRYE